VTPKVQISSLSFFYGKYQALYDVDMDIHDRQITAFIGPSGCGKSTLLRTLNRIYELYPGQRATGKDHDRRPQPARARGRRQPAAGQGGNGVSEGDGRSLCR